jgi:hypothetical protein
MLWLTLAGELVQDHFTVNLMVGEVDSRCLRGLGLDLCRCELPKRPMWSCGIEMLQVDRENPRKWRSLATRVLVPI